MDKNQLYLAMVRRVGKNIDGQYRYEFIFTDNKEECWGDNFEVKPAGLCRNLELDDKYITKVITVNTDIKLDLVTECNCFSIQDAMDGIVAIAYENIDDYDEFPDNGRLVMHFGEKIEEVARKMAIKNILLEE